MFSQAVIVRASQEGVYAEPAIFIPAEEIEACFPVADEPIFPPRFTQHNSLEVILERARRRASQMTQGGGIHVQ